jgi:hypothetical protein
MVSSVDCGASCSGKHIRPFLSARRNGSKVLFENAVIGAAGITILNRKSMIQLKR